MIKKFRHKILILIIFIVLLSTKMFAQHGPIYSQYLQNMMSINPAYTGTKEALNVLFLTRLQWVGMEGAPRSHTLSMHTPIKKRKIGIGANIISDNIGPVNSLYANFNYAYRVMINNKAILSMGLKLGIYNNYINLTSLEINGSDNAFSQDFTNRVQPNFGTGGYLYTSKYFFGLSASTILDSDLRDISSVKLRDNIMSRHLYFMGGYNFNLNKDWMVKPSILYQIMDENTLVLDINTQIEYKEKFRMGTSYRIYNTIVFMFNIQINKQLQISYANDVNVSGLNNISGGSHEIMVIFDFIEITGNNVKSPRFF